MSIFLSWARHLGEEQNLSKAIELTAFSRSHSGADAEIEEEARTILERLASKVSPEILSDTTARGNARSFDELVRELMDQGDSG